MQHWEDWMRLVHFCKDVNSPVDALPSSGHLGTRLWFCRNLAFPRTGARQRKSRRWAGRLKITFSNLFSIFLYILGVDALAWGKSGQPQPLFVLFSFFNNNILQKTVYFSGIWTRIVELQGEYADHLTTITASSSLLIPVIYFPTM